ncbi:hypothetical protein AGMMS50262_22390 [Bacteroidia bacterium]|nr:hypothetical protein AGMMS50262_22390 [Bacteroidia bacterium]
MVNKNLDFAKAHHAVLSYDWNVSDNIHFRIEPYFQYLVKLPKKKVLENFMKRELNQ